MKRIKRLKYPMGKLNWKNFLLTLLVTSSCLNANGQQLAHDAKSYTTEEGKVFWNKNTPVYIRIASSPEDKGVLLKNDDQPQYTNPIYLDTEGINYIRTRNAVDNNTKKQAYPAQEVMLPVYADGEAPISKSNYVNAIRYNKDGIVYLGKGLQIELLSADAVSGVENIYYSIHGSEYQIYNSPINYNVSGASTLKYYAVDHVGNVESENEMQLVLDHEAPVTTLQSSGPQIDNTFTYDSMFDLIALDSLSGVKMVYYKIDDQEYSLYRGAKISLNQLEDGYHTISYYSVDQVNNEEKESSYEFFFDISAPLTAADILGDRFIANDQIYFSGRTKLKFTAVDNRVGLKEVKYSINDQDFTTYENPFYLPNARGIHLIRYYSVDNFGNKTNDERTTRQFHEYEHLATKVYVDLTGPNLHYDFSGALLETRDTVFVRSDTKIMFEAEDTESGLQKITYSLEGSAEEFEYSTPISFDEKGYHAVDFYGYDNVNNRNVSHMNIFVDNIGAEIFFTFSGEPYVGADSSILVYSPDVNIYLAATDDHVGVQEIYYTLNSEKEQVYTAQIKNLKKGKTYSLQIRAIDLLGNETNKQVEFRISKK